MGRRKQKAKERLDQYYQLAREQGYRSRSAFKLVQINRRFDLLSRAHAVLDLCAAPGGWLQVVQQHLPVASPIVGVDTATIRPIRGVATVNEDITSPSCPTSVVRASGGVSTFDLVLHDGAPNVSGAWAKDAYEQSCLTLDALRFASRFLSPGGAFVTKVFRSSEYTSLLYALSQLFSSVQPHKPSSSRHESAEIFLVCQHYKAPSCIDPRLLDHRYLFADVADAAADAGSEAAKSALQPSQKRKLPSSSASQTGAGYERGASLVDSPITSSSLMRADKPADTLGAHSRVELQSTRASSEQEKHDMNFILHHSETTQEIRALCEDLRLLNRADFKKLIRWRTKVRKELIRKEHGQTPRDSQRAAKDGKVEAEERGDEDSEERLLREMAEHQSRLNARSKRLKRREANAKEKSRIRQSQGSGGETAMGFEEEGNLFNLRDIPSGGAMQQIASSEAPNVAQEHDDDNGEFEVAADDEETEEIDDLDDDAQRQSELEAGVDAMFEQYKERHKELQDRERLNRKKVKLNQSDEDVASAEEAVKREAPPREALSSLPEPRSYDGDGNALVVGEDNSAEQRARRWFDQDIFKDAGIDHDEDANESTGNKQLKHNDLGKGAEKYEEKSKLSHGKQEGVAATLKRDDDDNNDVAAAKRDHKERQTTGDGNDFEVVPKGTNEARAEADEGEEAVDDDSADEMDEHDKAVVRAMGWKIKSQKGRQEVEDAAYNRWNIDEDENELPEWFLKEEKRFMKPQESNVVSKQDIQEAKGQLRKLDDKPVKKVAEARARRKKKEEKKLQTAKAKAESISGSSALSEPSKRKEIERVYSKALKSSKQPHRRNKPNKPLDRRMKADAQKDGSSGKQRRAKGKSGKSKALKQSSGRQTKKAARKSSRAR